MNRQNLQQYNLPRLSDPQMPDLRLSDPLKDDRRGSESVCLSQYLKGIGMITKMIRILFQHTDHNYNVQ